MSRCGYAKPTTSSHDLIACHPSIFPSKEFLPMMGTKERSFAPLIHVSLEELVPLEHFYRHLERTLDLSCVREYVHPPLKAQCTTSKQGRTLCRSVHEDYLDRVRAFHTTEAHKKAYRKHSVWVEPLCAEGKDWHGMRRLRLRELERVNGEALMRAAGQNLKRRLEKTRRAVSSGTSTGPLCLLFGCFRVSCPHFLA